MVRVAIARHDLLAADSLVAVAVDRGEVVGTVLSRSPDDLRAVLPPQRYHLLQYVAVAERER